jgi:hypothetical protein
MDFNINLLAIVRLATQPGEQVQSWSYDQWNYHALIISRQIDMVNFISVYYLQKHLTLCSTFMAGHTRKGWHCLYSSVQRLAGQKIP